MGNEFKVGSKALKEVWNKEIKSMHTSANKNYIKKVASEYKNPIKNEPPSNTNTYSVAQAQKSQALVRPNTKYNPKEVGLSRAEIDRLVKLHPEDGYVPVDKWIDGHHIIYDGPNSSIDEFGHVLIKNKKVLLKK